MDPTAYEQLVELGYTPEQIDYIMELVSLGGMGPLVEKKRDYAAELRGARMPTGRAYRGVYTAADPLEFIGAGLQSAAGHYGEWKAQKQQEQILKDIEERRKAALGRGVTSPPAAPPVDPGVIVGGPRR